VTMGLVGTKGFARAGVLTGAEFPARRISETYRSGGIHHPGQPPLGSQGAPRTEPSN